MKKILISSSIGFVLLLMFLILPVKSVSAIESLNSNLQYVQTEIGGNMVYHLVDTTKMEQNEKSNIKTTNASITEDAVTSIHFTIHDPEHIQTINSNDINVLGKNYYSSDMYYYELQSGSYIITQTTDGWLVNVSGIDWTSANEAIVSVKTSKYLFYTTAYHSQVGSTIALIVDDTYTTINPNVTYAGSGFSCKLQLNLIDPSGKACFVGTISSDILVPSGKYDIQVLGKDTSYGYYLTKTNAVIDKNSNTITFNNNEAGIVEAGINDDSATNNFKLNSFVAMRGDYSVYYPTFGFNSNLVYVSNFDYTFISSAIMSQSGWIYSYLKLISFSINNNTYKLSVGTKLKSAFGPMYSVYGKGNSFSDIYICDEFKNRLVSSRGPTPNDAQPTGLLTLTDSNGIRTNITASNGVMPVVQLPNTTGTYDMSYSVTGGILSVTPLTGQKITIGDTSSGFILAPTNGPNMVSTSNITSNEIDLKWEDYYSSNSFNIYRATSSTGPFTVIGTSYSTAFFDTTVQPSTSYWYQVTAMRNSIESVPSSMIKVDTNNIAVQDKSVTFTLEDINHSSIFDLNNFRVIGKYIYGNGVNSYNYQNEGGNVPYISKTDSGWSVKYNNFKWNRMQEKTLVIKNSYLLIRRITQNDEGKVIPITINDNDYKALTINVPFAEGSFSLNGILVSQVDQNGVKMTLANVSSSTKLPLGNYNMIIRGTDNSKGYFVFKENFNLSQQNNIVTLDRNELGIVKVNLNSANYVAKLFDFSANSQKYNESYGLTTSIGVYSEFYLSKLNYYNFNIGYMINNNFSLNYNIPRTVDIQDDSTIINLDTILHSKFNLADRIYGQGECINGAVNIYDSYNNCCFFYSSNTATFEFKDSNGNIVASSTASNPTSPALVVPNIEGTYDVTYSVNGSSIPIEPSTTKITISSTSLASKPLNLTTTSIKINEIDLAWDSVSTASWYYIYRSTGDDSYNLLVRTSNTNSFKDLNINPATKYKYYVVAVNEAGAGAPSDTLSVESLSDHLPGDVNGDGIIDNSDFTSFKDFLLNRIYSFTSGNGFHLADVDGDGIITSRDYVLLRRMSK
jgi:hypothetical protein